jgi:hypothetical protein
MTTVDGPLDRLEALLSRLEAAAFERASSQQLLLDAVRHQLADGQVETLIALERSVAAVRASSDQLALATETPVRALTDAAQMLASAVDQAVQAARLQLATEGDAAVTRVHRNMDAAEVSLARAVVEAAEELSGHVEAALEAQRAIAETASHAGEAIRVAGAQAVRELQSAGVQLVQAIQQQATEFAAQSNGFTSAVAALLERWEKRDARRDTRVETRVEALVQRVDAGWQEIAAALLGATRELAERDSGLERQRADEFARVLNDILSRAGTSPRRLRSRVTKVLDDERAARPAPAPPVTSAEAPPATAQPRRHARTKDKESG